MKDFKPSIILFEKSANPYRAIKKWSPGGNLFLDPGNINFIPPFLSPQIIYFCPFLSFCDLQNCVSFYVLDTNLHKAIFIQHIGYKLCCQETFTITEHEKNMHDEFPCFENDIH